VRVQARKLVELAAGSLGIKAAKLFADEPGVEDAVAAYAWERHASAWGPNDVALGGRSMCGRTNPAGNPGPDLSVRAGRVRRWSSAVVAKENRHGKSLLMGVQHKFREIGQGERSTIDNRSIRLRRLLTLSVPRADPPHVCEAGSTGEPSREMRDAVSGLMTPRGKRFSERPKNRAASSTFRPKMRGVVAYGSSAASGQDGWAHRRLRCSVTPLHGGRAPGSNAVVMMAVLRQFS